ncbi:phage protein Gp36 family protein [Antrihabitans sp. YC2-6]|uniref:phage protein Gp36 family protein n=1 Tax=Antrihabitans sp. YC2-6 TaxID=2799498 RepID=UPI0018F42960|nr:phage protein Gp36 family protein [Antrihabitans sp. YC2-6]MBJ8343941.1 DUF1320 family protein [Antrihabitans sp. YC2-6]
MATTLQAESFANINLTERSTLDESVLTAATTIKVVNTSGFEAGKTIYVGPPGSETCEKAVVNAVTDETTLELVDGLGQPHSRFDAVTGVLGDRIRIYRAVNVDDSAPADVAFSALASRSIDPGKVVTYYTDSSGSSDYWYKLTYWNETTGDETDLDDSTPVRGDDYGRYASLTEIRRDAGFLNATNLSDVTVDQKRRMAEAEINTALSNRYTVPFKPVPEQINSLTIQIAAGLLLQDAYGETSTRAVKKLKDARLALEQLKNADGDVVDDQGQSVSTGDDISGYPDDSASRAFTMDQVF